jgi:uncharacterized membrane protein YheB (UPF0754 family)
LQPQKKDERMNWWLLTIPVISACIGWITNLVAIKLLFSRIIPRQQPLIAQKIGKLVSTELLSFDEIGQKITSPENIQKIMPVVEQHMDDFLRNRLKQAFPIISMFISDKMIGELKVVFMKELEELFPVMMKNYVKNLEQDLDLEHLVTTKLASFPPEKLEAGLSQSMRKEFRGVNLFAAAIGFCIGLVQLLIVILTSK